MTDVNAEKEILARSENPWIVDLVFSFQDDKHLFLVMEYMTGGDLMALLMKEDILREDATLHRAFCVLFSFFCIVAFCLAVV